MSPNNATTINISPISAMMFQSTDLNVDGDACENTPIATISMISNTAKIVSIPLIFKLSK